MKQKACFAICAIVLLSVLFPYSAFAKVSILNRTGEISITMPDGTVTKVAADQALPATIPDNAVITILSGSADVSASEASTVKVVCGDYSAVVSTGNALTAGLDPESKQVTMTLIYGTAEVTGPDGKKVVLDNNNPSLKGIVPGQQEGDSQLPSEKEIGMDVEKSARDISPSA